MLNAIHAPIKLERIDAGRGSVQGSVHNSGTVAIVRDNGPGEFRVGLRVLKIDTDVVILEGRAFLPERICPGETFIFDIRYEPACLPAGRYTFELELLYEEHFWLSLPGCAVCRAEVVVQQAIEWRHQLFGPDPEHPYRNLPPTSFWKTAVVNQTSPAIDPVVAVPFLIEAQQKVAAAGSCFAQYIAQYLETTGFNFLRTEPGTAGTTFSANFGNIYTARQLYQLLLRAYGLMQPVDVAWQRGDGRFIDPFRPQLFEEGFPDQDSLCEARADHLLNVRRVFEQADVLVFTLGLTEGWVNAEDGAALPVPPGVVAARAGVGPYAFMNYSAALVEADLNAFIAAVRMINPGLKLILTVSPVPLVATYTGGHVLTSNAYSKAALRVAAEAVVRSNSNVAYFPSYEIVTAPTTRGAFFQEDLRSVTRQGVESVMAVFAQHFLVDHSAADDTLESATNVHLGKSDPPRTERNVLADVLCDEQTLAAIGAD